MVRLPPLKEHIGSTLGWITVVAAAELLAFYLLQTSLTESNPLYLVGACLLFGIVVPLAFRESLRSGTNVPIANLYWIVFSEIGAVLLAYFVFKQTLSKREMVAIGLLLVSFFLAITS